MKYLINGGCGFLGSNIASEVLRRGEELTVYDNLSRVGSDKNLAWLRTFGDFNFIQANTADAATLENTVRDFKPDVIFHLAGQVAMTTSIANPRLDFETNTLGGFNVLEAARKHAPDATIAFSSTNKVYGDFEQFHFDETPTRYVCREHPNGFDESIPLDFHSPYGCSKGATDQYMLDYARIFHLNTVVFRHSSMYGARQFGTFDQGWISWFVQKAIETRKSADSTFTISGNGKQVRDVLHAEDMIRLYFAAVEHIKEARGQVFNIGGGMPNSLSLLELFTFLESELSIKMKYSILPPRESDQKVFVADITKAERILGWHPQVSKETGIRKMIEWVGEE